jgi:ATP-dependent Lon protease
MDNIHDFFNKLSRKRPRSYSMDEKDEYTRDEYINYIKSKIEQFMNSVKTYRQITKEINMWLEELDVAREETTKTKEELMKLTQKLHDVSVSEKILYELLDYLKRNKEDKTKLLKNEILKYLEKMKTMKVNKLKRTIPEEETLSDFIVEDDYEEDEEDDDDEYDSAEDSDYEEGDEVEDNYGGMLPIILKLNNKRNDFLEEWNKRFEDIRMSSAKSMSNEECHTYLNSLNKNDREKILCEAERIEGIKNNEKPMYFRILDLPIPLEERKVILKEYNSIGFDSKKTKAWLEKVMMVPFGKYIENKSQKNVSKFIKSLIKQMDSVVYGHENAKRKIVQIMCQRIRNSKAKGLVIGIEGVPGNGKTSLIEQGICKVLKRPFIPISLGGASDSSFLVGHSFTYEGSIPGKIAEALIQSECMNPVFYFDELDKISETHKGMEIVNLLVHLIDPSQNSHFRDKYFHGLSLDLSRATFIFSFNDSSLINPILLDRITVVKTDGLDLNQKKIIANDYLMPSIMNEMGMKENSIKLDEELIVDMITKYTYEGGVRGLKELLFHMCRELNIYNLTKTRLNEKKVKFPYELNREGMNVLLKEYDEIKDTLIHTENKIGVVNGMWANSYGMGGVLPIEILTYPSSAAFSIKKTGSLKKVIQESIEVALSVSWNHLSDKKKDEWMKYWKKTCEGFHVHCPEGATPKDGPSAGTALSLAFYSLLSKQEIPNTISITGEMNLQGRVTKIGGLKEKITGAKRAGVKKIFYPLENEDDMKRIREKNGDILEGLELVSLETFSDLVDNLGF